MDPKQEKKIISVWYIKMVSVNEFYKSGKFWVYAIVVIVVYILNYVSYKHGANTAIINQLADRNIIPSPIIFFVVWAILYILIIFGGYLTDINLFNQSGYQISFEIIFAIFMILNLAWPYVFYVQKNYKMSMYISVLLLIFVIVLMVYAYHSRLNGGWAAFWLFVPYLLWMLYATYLNGKFYNLVKNI